jgi:hypothetical protein
MPVLQEIQDLFAASYTIADPDEKIKARQAVVAGPLQVKFKKLAQLLVS